jgi:hypothetical protein
MPNRKYLVLQRRAPSAAREAPSPLQMQEMYAAFDAWKEKFKTNIVDLGSPLKPGGVLVTSAGVTDGPLMESKEIIGGYMIITADSPERAIQVARESPGLSMPGASLEIRELAGH